MGKYFEEFAIGETFTTQGRTVTECDITRFAGLSGDYNPLHIDEEFARRSQFKGRIAHGALTFSILTGFWDQLGIIKDTVVALYGVDSMRFIRPVFIGDTLSGIIEVVGKEEREEDGIVTLRNEMRNHREEQVMICIAKVLMKKTP
ncbi:MAG: MaoC family dehydratase N-terminal domain-containing protein [Theionarchaea archaeon]|nr:MaoC family dehydratase N-terminal domain-containing protein [Theionarchaea archaeon]